MSLWGGILDGVEGKRKRGRGKGEQGREKVIGRGDERGGGDIYNFGYFRLRSNEGKRRYT